MRELLRDFGDVRYVWRHLPLNDVHPNTQLASEASEAADDQGAFWEMHDLLFAHQDALRPSDLISYAEQLGLDVERFTNHLRQRAGAGRVAEDVDSADLSGVSGTPTFFVNGRRHYGAYDIGTVGGCTRRPARGDYDDHDQRMSSSGSVPRCTFLPGQRSALGSARQELRPSAGNRDDGRWRRGTARPTMPDFDVSEIHDVELAAAPEVAVRRILGLHAGSDRIVRFLSPPWASSLRAPLDRFATEVVGLDPPSARRRGSLRAAACVAPDRPFIRCRRRADEEAPASSPRPESRMPASPFGSTGSSSVRFPR